MTSRPKHKSVLRAKLKQQRQELNHPVYVAKDRLPPKPSREDVSQFLQGEIRGIQRNRRRR